MFDFEAFSEGDFLSRFTMIFCLVFFFIVIATAVTLFIVGKKKGKNIISTREIVYGGVCLAIAYALSFFGIKMPNGGTITLASSLPIMIFCYFFGLRKGLFVCVAYTLLQVLQEPKIYHPMGLFLDYIIPYLALISFGFISVNRKKMSESLSQGAKQNVLKNHTRFFIAALIYIVIRYVSHVLSGAILFADFKLMGSWTYSLVYNLNFIVDATIATVVGGVLLSSKAFLKLMLTPTSPNQNNNQESVI